MLLFAIPCELVRSESSERGHPVTPVDHRQIYYFGVVRHTGGQPRGSFDEGDEARALSPRQQAVGGDGRRALCRLLLGHLGVHCRATSSAPLAKKTPKAAGFMAEQLQPEEDGLWPELPSYRFNSLRQLLEQQQALLCQQPLEALERVHECIDLCTSALDSRPTRAIATLR